MKAPRGLACPPPAWLGCLLAAACSAHTDDLPVPARVVVIVIDATHAAHLGCYGGPDGLTPSIDGLAGRGVRFDRAFSNSTWTLPSTVSLMTGLLQEHHGVLTNRQRAGDDATLLAERFSSAGWHTAAFVEMVYASDAYGLQQGFRDYRYYPVHGRRHRDLMILDVLAWMDAHRADRTLLYVHFRRPHGPYDPNPLFRYRLEAGCPLADGRLDADLSLADVRATADLPPEQREHVRHLYRGNLATVDDRLAGILDRARRWGDTLVVLTADHGEGLGQHDHFGHGPRLFAEHVDIPLILAGPGIEPAVDSDPASTVDLLPTLLEICAVGPRDAALDGVSLIPRLVHSSPAFSVPVPLSARYTGQNRPDVGAIEGPWKLILHADGSAALYDRVADRGDARNVADRHPDVVDRLVKVARELRTAAPLLPKAPVELPAEREQDLRALGYIR